MKGSWHKPSAEALANAENVKEQAKSYAGKAKQQAERLVQDEKNRRRTMERELEKKTNIATNLEVENTRLGKQLETSEDDRKQLLEQLKQFNSKGGGTGGSKPN